MPKTSFSEFTYMSPKQRKLWIMRIRLDDTAPRRFGLDMDVYEIVEPIANAFLSFDRVEFTARTKLAAPSSLNPVEEMLVPLAAGVASNRGRNS